jgi:hypothetical protein
MHRIPKRRILHPHPAVEVDEPVVVVSSAVHVCQVVESTVIEEAVVSYAADILNISSVSDIPDISNATDIFNGSYLVDVCCGGRGFEAGVGLAEICYGASWW